MQSAKLAVEVLVKDDEVLFKEYETDFAYCEAIIKKYSKSFYTAFSRLPSHKAKSVYAIYAFCRQADDMIDLEKNEAGLDALKDQLIAFEAGNIPNEPVWRALHVVFQSFPMDIGPFYDMLMGQRKDLVFRQPETKSELADYCYYVAGSVGLMLLPILSSQVAKIKTLAKKLGEAMQLTNILRDIGEDERMGRIYLPKEEMEAFHVTEEMLRGQQPTKSFIALWESLAQLAETQYDESLAMLPFIHIDCQEALTAAAFIYREQLTVIRENQYAVFDKKNKVSMFRKLQLLIQTKVYLKKLRHQLSIN